MHQLEDKALVTLIGLFCLLKAIVVQSVNNLIAYKDGIIKVYNGGKQKG